MPRGKINIEKVRAALNTICTEWGASISPDQIQRIDFERQKCPVCGAIFTPAPKGPPTRMT